MKKLNKAISIIIALMMIIALMPSMAFANGETSNSSTVTALYVNETAIIENGAATGNTVEGVSYDINTNTLTLNGASITTGYSYSDTGNAGIYASGNLNLVIAGNNTFGSANNPLTEAVKVTDNTNDKDNTNNTGKLTLSVSGNLDFSGVKSGINADTIVEVAAGRGGVCTR